MQAKLVSIILNYREEIYHMKKSKKSIVLMLAAMSLGVAAPTSAASVSDIRVNIDGVYSWYNDHDHASNFAPDGNSERYTNSYTRVRFKVKLDDKFSYTARLHSGYYNTSDYYIQDDVKTYFDQNFITYRNSAENYAVEVGKTGAFLGQGLMYDAMGNMDGVKVTFGNYWDKGSQLQLIYGDKQKGNAFRAIDYTSWVTPDLQLSGTYLYYQPNKYRWSNYDKKSQRYLTRNSPHRYFSIGAKAKLGTTTFVVERSHNENVNNSNDANGFVAQLYTGPTSDFTNLPYSKVGTESAVLTYQNIGYNSVVSPVSGWYSDKRGWRIGYGKVIAPGLAASIELGTYDKKGGSSYSNSGNMGMVQLSYKL